MPGVWSLAARKRVFYARVEKTDTCWLWTGPLDARGYGRSHVKLKHRLAWELERGPIPDGMTVDHICFVRHCVRIEHLQLLTLSENCARKQSQERTHCRRGHEFSPENTRMVKNSRVCKQCVSENHRARRQAKS